MKNVVTSALRFCCVGAICIMASDLSAAVVEWTEDHGDIAIAYEDGELELHYHFEEGVNGVPPIDVEFEPDEAYIRVADAAKKTANAFDELNGYLGLTAGDDFWVLPQSNGGPGGAGTLGLPFVGIAAEGLDADFTSMSLSLTNLNGPGAFALWQDGTPATVFMDSFDGISGSDVLSFSNLNSHDHYNFGFTAEGVYEVEFTATGDLIGGGTATDTGVFTFAVGSTTAVPEPSSFAALASLGLIGSVFRRRRKS